MILVFCAIYMRARTIFEQSCTNMSPQASLPSYVVVSPGFEGRDAQPMRWLGRFVQFPEAPAAKFAPFGIDLRETLEQYFMSPVIDSNAIAFSQTVQNKKLSTDLLGLVALGRDSEKDKGLEVQASKIATFTLCQYAKVLEALLNVPDVRKQTLDLLRASKRKAYMIVGVKVLYTGAIAVRKSSTTSHNASINVPVAEIAALAAGVPLPLLGLGNVGFARENAKSDSSAAHYEILKRRIFAFEYRAISFGKSLIRRLSMDPALLHGTPKYKFGNQVFGDDESSEDDDQDEDDVADDGTKNEIDDENAELLLNEAPIKLADVNDGLGFETSTYGPIEEAEDGEEQSAGGGMFIHGISED